MEVEHKVDKQIQSMTNNLISLQKHHNISKLKDKIFNKNIQKQDKVGKKDNSIPSFVFNNE